MDVNGEKLTETSNIEDYSVGLRWGYALAYQL
jgi:hypothetical protein